MKKTLCTLLALSLLLSPLTVIAVTGGAAMSTSDSGIAFIEQLEGFRGAVYEVNGGYYIGYGTACEAGDYAFGIDEETADALLRQDLAEIENKLSSFINTYGISLSQAQFDALVSFTYNLGSEWMSASCRLRSHLIDGVSGVDGQEIMNAMGIWCHIGGEVSPTLAERRILEGKLFLFGDYTGLGGIDFNYVILDAAGGTVEDDILFFFSGAVVGELPEATRTGYAFDGWYTSTGQALNPATVITQHISVTAHWTASQMPGTWANPYKDVLQTDWFYTYVAELSYNGVINGYPDSTFRPRNSVTCGEALKLILLAAGCSEQTATGEHWASGYLDFALNMGYVCEGEIGNLSSAMSRLTIAKLAAAALNLSNCNFVSPFADTADPAVLGLYEAGILQGSYDAQGVLKYFPEKGIIRSEVSAVIWRIMDFVGQTAPQGDEDDDDVLPYGAEPIPGVPVYSYDQSGFFSENGIKYYSAGGLTAKVGIDVSEHQGEIDWGMVAASGVEFAIIRVGYRGYTDGGLYEDSMFTRNIQGALSAGLKVGVYFFSQAVNSAEAVQEALFVLERIAPYPISYPVIFDWENFSACAARTDGVTTQRLCESATAYCSAVEAAGYRGMIYFNTYIGLVLYDLSKIMQYDFWFAGYTSVPKFYYNFAMWQYWSSGWIDGIPKAVDMDLCFYNYG